MSEENFFGKYWTEKPETIGQATANILYLLSRPWKVRLVPKEDGEGSYWFLDPPIPKEDSE